MNFFARIWNVIVGRTNALVESVENPEDQLRIFVSTLDSEMTKLRQAVTAAIAEEKKLKMKIENLLLQSQDWKKKAMFALNQGKEDLAREALIRKGDAENEAIRLRADLERQAEAVEKLQQALRATQQKTEKAKRDYTVLLARYRSAKTQMSINKQLNGLSENSPNNLIENLNDRILKIEAETQADLQMIGSGSSPDLEASFVQLEQQYRGDEALTQLKAKMQSQPLLAAASKADKLNIIDVKKKVGG